MQSRMFYVRLISALYLATFLIRMSFGIASVGFVRWVPPEDIGRDIYGILWATASICEFIFALIVGVLIDRYGRRGMLLFGLLIGAGSLICTILTKNLVVMFLARGLLGIGAAAILVSSLALLTDYAPKNKRGREMGAFDAINLLGWFVGFAAGFVLLGIFGEGRVYLLFIVGGGLAGFGLLYSLLNVKEPEKKCVTVEHISLGMLRTVLLNRSVVLLIMPWLVVFIVIGSALAFGPSEGSSDALNISWQRAAVAIVIIGAVLISTQLFFGRLSDKVGRMPVLAVGTLGITGLMVSIAVLFFSTHGHGLHGAGAERFIVYVVIGLSLILALAFGPSSLASLADVADVKTRGMTMGLYSVVITIGLSTGSIVVGFISEHAGPGAVVVFFLISAAVMVTFVVLRFVDVKYWGQNKASLERTFTDATDNIPDGKCKDQK